MWRNLCVEVESRLCKQHSERSRYLMVARVETCVNTVNLLKLSAHMQCISAVDTMRAA